MSLTIDNDHLAPEPGHMPSPEVARRWAKNNKFIRGDVYSAITRYLSLKQYNRVQVLLRFHLEHNARFVIKPMTAMDFECKDAFPYPYPGPLIVRVTASNTYEGRTDPPIEFRIAAAHDAVSGKEKLSDLSTALNKFLWRNFCSPAFRDNHRLDKIHAVEATVVLRDPSGVFCVLEGNSTEVPYEAVHCGLDSGVLQVISGHPLLAEF